MIFCLLRKRRLFDQPRRAAPILPHQRIHAAAHVGAPGAHAQRGEKVLVHILPRTAAVIILYVALHDIAIVVTAHELQYFRFVGHVVRSLDHGPQARPVLSAVDDIQLIRGDVRSFEQVGGQSVGPLTCQFFVALASSVRRGHPRHPNAVDHIIAVSKNLLQGANESLQSFAVAHELRGDHALAQLEIDRSGDLLGLRLAAARLSDGRVLGPDRQNARNEDQKKQ